MPTNHGVIEGNLTRDPELTYTQGGMAWCNFSIAHNKRSKDKSTGEWKDNTSFFNVKMCGKSAESFQKFVRKGDGVMVEYSLDEETWDDKETHKKRSSVKLFAQRCVKMVKPPREGEEERQPARTSAPRPAPKPQQQEHKYAAQDAPQDGEVIEGVNEDVPF